MSIGTLKGLRDGLAWGQEAITILNYVISNIRDASNTVAGLLETATDAEYLAKTATDKALVPSNLAALPTFVAHKNGTNQTGITSATDILVTFSATDFNVGSYFSISTSKFIPPAGKYRISANLHFTATNAVDGETLRTQINKNGSQLRIAAMNRAGTAGQGVPITCVVPANGTDEFTLIGRKDGAGDGAILGDASFTWFCAEAVA